MKQESVMLARTLQDRHHIGGWLLSEKLDGMRVIWDGGCTRVMDSRDVPWANNVKGHGISTGLWSRYMKIVYAPDWWLDRLPRGICLDGELYAGRDSRQYLLSNCKRQDGTGDWSEIKLAIFDTPPTAMIFDQQRTIEVRQGPEVYKFTIAANKSWNGKWTAGVESGYVSRMAKAHEYMDGRASVYYVLNQLALPLAGKLARETAEQILCNITAGGGEGIMLRTAHGHYKTERTSDLLKWKKFDDSEGVIIGFTTGNGKLQGLIGSVRVKWGSIIFDISGFTEKEREWENSEAVAFAKAHPDTVSPYNGESMKHGDLITFMYRGLSTRGVPNEARFWRKYES